MTTHRERAAEYADAALTLRTMVEALELRAAEELALAREFEIENEERAEAWRGLPFPGASLSGGAPCWPPIGVSLVNAGQSLFVIGKDGMEPFVPTKRSIS